MTKLEIIGNLQSHYQNPFKIIEKVFARNRQSTEFEQHNIINYTVKCKISHDIIVKSVTKVGVR